MAPIYSTQLYNGGTVGSVSPVIFTVPAGATVVVTDIDTWLDFGAGTNVSYIALKSLLLLYAVSSAAQILNQQWQGKQVLNAGDSIQVVTTTVVARFAVTGYLLRP